MKVKVFPNSVFSFTMLLMGGIEDVPTKQDKYKPVEYLNPYYEDVEGNKISITDNLYILSQEKTETQKKFQDILLPEIEKNLKNEHPYKKPQQLEVAIGITTGIKRYKKVDIDNLVKFVLDCFNGLVYEDDSQIASIIASKQVIKDDFVPEVSSLAIGIRLLNEDRKMLNNIPIYLYEYISEWLKQKLFLNYIKADKREIAKKIHRQNKEWDKKQFEQMYVVA